MSSMAIDRRTLLIGAAVVVAAGRRGIAAALPQDAEVRLVSACQRADGSHAIALLSREGRILREVPLRGRGHDIAFDPGSGRAVAFARQPGLFAVAFDVSGETRAPRAPVVFAPPENRCLFGHGLFSPDGRLLYATENDLDSGEGRLGIYDAHAGFARIGELSTFGVGPHEVILLRDGRTLAIANGGYEMRPDTGRIRIDVEAMQPSLVFVDRLSGELITEHRLPAALNALSIRHLAAGPGGTTTTVWFGAQWEGDMAAIPELIGCAGRDSPIRLVTPASPLGRALKGYVGSVAISRDGSVVAASAPRAGRIVFVDPATATVRATTTLADGCGIAGIGGDSFAASSGLGVLQFARAGAAPDFSETLPGVAFDNHMRLVL
jgi:hypothetical protein